MEKYNPREIEAKWQKYWQDQEFFRAKDFSEKEKLYLLIEFPYPSGEGLHVGHVRSYSALDAVARKKRLEGYNVLFPIGWDAFGLPSENYAIKTGIHPTISTKKNIENYQRQLKGLGLSFDWSRVVNTTDPKYYRWTQWIFLKLFQHGLAYQTEMPINWCPSCKIGLANEEVVGGNCERCGTPVEKKVLKQWLIKITQYADKLVDDLEQVNFPEKIKAQQVHWIGRSAGAEIKFLINQSQDSLSVFTTRVDTLFGATAVVLAPEHPLVEKLVTPGQREEVERYITETKKKSDFERENLEKEKTGVFTGSYCFNPINQEKIPIWLGDYVIATYGGGAVMVVPAHDHRDHTFASKYGLEVKEVVKKKNSEGISFNSEKIFVEEGVLVNSGKYSGLSSAEAIEKIIRDLEKKGLGKKIIQYKLRDWIFSRQHYWGEPIPIIHCPQCGPVPVPEEDLPVELPYVEKYEPTGTGRSPLAAMTDWLKVKCPRCGGEAERETDTMPNWAGSNWYFLAYAMWQDDQEKLKWEKDKIAYWLPVNWYNGGFEHTTLHLLYSRFIYKFLWEIGEIPNSVISEPYQRRSSHGIVLAEDGRKMSKSFGNTINPDNLVKEFGADTLRIYEMFMGPFDQAIAWKTQGMKGCHRFLERIWKLFLGTEVKEKSSPELIRALHKLIKKIDQDLEEAKFNTIIASLMGFVNLCQSKRKELGKDVLEKTLILLFPFTPHLAEELWQKLGKEESLFLARWPKYDSQLIKEELVTLIVQVNGRVRDKVEISVELKEEEVKELVLGEEKVKKWLQGKIIKKVIYLPGKLINLVV